MLIDSLKTHYNRLPEAFRHRILIGRRSGLWLRAGIVFIHVPRAAGTSFNQALYGRFMGHVAALEVERWASQEVRSLPSFAIVRNPWDRLVSAFRFAKRGSGEGGQIQAAIARPELYRGPQFETFESFVTEWLVKRDVATLDLVFRPQSQFLCDEQGKILVDHIGRLENLQPTLDFVQAKLGHPLNVDISNSSGKRTDYRDYYTPDLVTVVRQIYQKDIELFRYEFNRN